MNKKVFFSVMLVNLLALSLVFVSCDNGTSPGGGNTPNVFTITGITTQLKTESEKVCIVGMYPESTTADQALSDTKRIYGLETDHRNTLLQVEKFIITLLPDQKKTGLKVEL